jgi:DtxR family Mn-dependent transcriptional regulator
VVNRVRDSDPELLRYLSDLGLIPGAKVTVLDFSPFDNNLRLRVEAQDKAIVLGPSVTSQVFVGVV